MVVHGGGKQMTRFLAERGVESQFVNGLRVTGPAVVDALLKVFAGSVNHELVAGLNAAGALAVGLSGIDSFLVEAEQMDPALGAVGRVTRANPALLDLLTANGFVPVVACVAGDRQGRIYNINADQMAVACADRVRGRAADLPHRRRGRTGCRRPGPPRADRVPKAKASSMAASPPAGCGPSWNRLWRRSAAAFPRC